MQIYIDPRDGAICPRCGFLLTETTVRLKKYSCSFCRNHYIYKGNGKYQRVDWELYAYRRNQADA